MKPRTAKNRIVIPDLIKQLKPRESQKENICFNTPLQPKMNISHYLDQQMEQACQYNIDGPCKGEIDMMSNFLGDMEKPCKDQKESTDRGQESSKLGQESTERGQESVIESSMGLLSAGRGRLEELIKSQRMFINPDRWRSFLERALQEPQFHKALNGFLYNYFIQNYN